MNKNQTLVALLILTNCASSDIYSVKNSIIGDDKCGYPFVFGRIAPLEDQGRLESAIKVGLMEKGISANISIESLDLSANVDTTAQSAAIVESGVDCILNVSLRENSTLDSMNFDAELIDISSSMTMWVAGINSSSGQVTDFVDVKSAMFTSLSRSIANDLEFEGLLAVDHPRFFGVWKSQVSTAVWEFAENGEVRIEQDGATITGHFNVVDGNRLIVTSKELREASGETTPMKIKVIDSLFTFTLDNLFEICEGEECVVMEKQLQAEL